MAFSQSFTVHDQFLPCVFNRDESLAAFQRIIKGSSSPPGIYLVNLLQHYAFWSTTRLIALSIAMGHASTQASTSVSKASQRAWVKAGESEMAERQPHLTHFYPTQFCASSASVPSSAANRRLTANPDGPDITSLHTTDSVARPRGFNHDIALSTPIVTQGFS